eukprot:TRINITY_DN4077_c0_g1_i1.p1 TRINITY_DN4077_c0_g1~~TRINITY_DN4077_c0_g1_i1.p1  ORF type:complete len:944 (+),score=200.29 TRINITY_DN4077_c0_g1_i1:66-2897(+)
MSVGGERIALRSKYAYAAKHGDELSFPADADMFLVEKRENGWWKGEYNGVSGLFPYNYVDVVPSAAAAAAVPTPRPSQPDQKKLASIPSFNDGKERAIALDDYQAKDSQQLDFKKDEIIIIVQKFPTGWWKGENSSGRQGVFPQKTVKLLSDLKDEQEKGKKHKRGRSQTNRNEGSRKRSSSKSHNASPTSPRLVPPPGSGAEDAGSTESSVDASMDDDQSSEEQTSFGMGAPPSLPSLPPPSASSAKLSLPPGQYVKALEPYQASGPGQLSFNKGDVIRVIEKKEEDFWMGELNKAIGLFPTDCVEEIGGGSSSDGPKTIAVALFDYSGNTEGQLSFNKDDKITVLGKTENGWWRGELKGKVGHFPGSYVREESSADKESSTPKASASLDSITSARQPTMKALAIKSKAIAVHKYAAQDNNQLSFEPNDEITVLAKAANGWWSGELRGKIGHFPGSYVKELTDGNPSGPLSSRPQTTSFSSSPVDPANLRRASALYAYTAQSSSELSLKPGDELVILPTSAGDTKGWLTGHLVSNKSQIGHFPASYVKILDGEAAESASVSRTKAEVGRAKSVSLTPRRRSQERPDPPTATSGGPPSKAPPPVPPPGAASAEAPPKPLPPLPPGSRASLSLPSPTASQETDKTSPGSSRPPASAPPPLPPKDPSPPSEASTASEPSPQPVPVARAVSAAIQKSSDRKPSVGSGSSASLKPPGPRVDVSAPVTQTAGSSSSASANMADSGETAKEIEKIKNAMVKLQQQTKGAVEEMLNRIDAQQKERLKLEYVMRDMKRTVKEEKEARLRVEQQNRVLYTELQALKAREEQTKADNQINDEFSGMSASELRNQVRKLSTQLDQEVHARQDLQSFVAQLQADIDAVKRSVRRDAAPSGGMTGSGSFGGAPSLPQRTHTQPNSHPHSTTTSSSFRQTNGHHEHVDPDDYFYKPS